jgi:hypothetical protein
VVNQSSVHPAMSSHPIAAIAQARVRAAMGDVAGARQAYDQFLDLWKNADPDLPLLEAARRERAVLK